MTCAVTHLMIVPGGCPASKDASTLPGAGVAGVAAVTGVVVTGVVGVAVVGVAVVVVLFTVSAGAAVVVAVGVGGDCKICCGRVVDGAVEVAKVLFGVAAVLTIIPLFAEFNCTI